MTSTVLCTCFWHFLFLTNISLQCFQRRDKGYSQLSCVALTFANQSFLYNHSGKSRTFFFPTISSLLSSNPKVFPIKKWFWKSWNGWRRPLTRIVLSSEAVYILSPEDGMKMDVTAFVCSRISWINLRTLFPESHTYTNIKLINM